MYSTTPKQAGIISCVSLLHNPISNVLKTKPPLNAFLEVYETEALASAQAVDDKIKAGTAGRLAGMVIGIKDNICYKGHKLSAASKILEGFESLFSATVVERLLKEDVIIIGRLNCDEFAMGSTNENSAFGAVSNPINEEFVPGGSSGGSAVAVAADLCLALLGSDTGGSIRQPASFCGVMGYKPTYGRVSRWGLIAYASSFDQIGPFTHNAKDAALLMEIMSGADEYDSTCSEQLYQDGKLLENNQPRTIGYMKETLENKALCPEIKTHILEQIEQFKAQGHNIVEIDFSYLKYVVPAYYVLTFTAEASSNLARFDGIHFGHCEAPHDIPSTYANSRTEGFGEEVQRRIMLGTFVLSAGYYDAYTKAQKVRRLLHEKRTKYSKAVTLSYRPRHHIQRYKKAKHTMILHNYIWKIFLPYTPILLVYLQFLYLQVPIPTDYLLAFN